MGNVLFEKVTVISKKRENTVPYSSAELATAKQACLAAIKVFGGVPYRLENKKAVVDGYKFATAVKTACKEAGVQEKDRLYASWAFLAKKAIRLLIEEAKKEEAAAAKAKTETETGTEAA